VEERTQDWMLLLANQGSRQSSAVHGRTMLDLHRLVKNLSIDKMQCAGTKHTGVPVKTLKKLLKKAGLKVSGKKATLTRRAKKARLMKGGVPEFLRRFLPTEGVGANINIQSPAAAVKASEDATTKKFSERQPRPKFENIFSQKKRIFKGSPEQIAAEAERRKNQFVTEDMIDSFKKVEGNRQKLKEAFKEEYGYDLSFIGYDAEDYIIYRSHNVWEGSLEQRGARAERRNKPVETNVMINNFFEEKGADEKIKGAFKEKYGSDNLFDDPEMMRDYVIYYLNPDVANYEFPKWFISSEQKVARDERLTNGVEFANNYFDLMKQGKANAIPQSFLERYGYDIYSHNDDNKIKDYITHYFTVVVRDMDGGKKKTRRS
jgi:hypothetical protein